MTSTEILEKTKSLQGELTGHRRHLHSHPGVRFDLQETYQYVYDQLVHIGYAPNSYGKCGLIASCGHSEKGKTILLRADMDALQICEEADVEFASTNGNMHANGHDIHTAMLLGAARILKEQEANLKGRVILLFQPAGETFEGAKDMIDAGVLRNTTPSAALALHITTDMPFQTGTVIVSDSGVSAPSADFFEIQIKDNGCHGSMPQTTTDTITAAAHIIAALEQIHAREIPVSDKAVITIQSIHAETASNAIADKSVMGGSIRSYDEDTRRFIKDRMHEIIARVADSLHMETSLTFTSGCPAMVNDASLSADITKYAKELLGTEMAFNKSDLTSAAKSMGKATASEDFAYFSKEVPSLMLAIAGGKAEDGYTFPQHHPKVKFDETVLSYGTAVYAYSAVRWLEEH